MIRLHYNNQTNAILGAYADDDSAPTPNIIVADDAWVEYDAVENGALVHNGISLAGAKNCRIAVMKAAENAALSAGFTTQTYLMDTDMSHAMSLKLKYDVAFANGQTTINIIDYNNDTQSGVAVATALQMALELGTNADALHDQFQARRTSINAAADVAAVNAINWS